MQNRKALYSVKLLYALLVVEYVMLKYITVSITIELGYFFPRNSVRSVLCELWRRREKKKREDEGRQKPRQTWTAHLSSK